MKCKAKPVLFSMKPRYADLVFQGLKTAELRRRIFLSDSEEDRDVFIYVSSPEQLLRGVLKVKHVWKGTPQEIWNEVSRLVHVEKKDFDAYYKSRKIAYALRIDEVYEYENPASLDTLRKKFTQFVIPQSWRYLKPEEYRSFRNMKRKTKPPVPQKIAS